MRPDMYAKYLAEEKLFMEWVEKIKKEFGGDQYGYEGIQRCYRCIYGNVATVHGLAK